MEIILDLSRVSNFSNSSINNQATITKIIPPANFSIITHIRRNDFIDEFEHASVEDEESVAGKQPTKLDIDFKHKKVIML